MEEDITTLLDRIAETIEGVDNMQIQSEELKQSFLYHYTNCYYKANTVDPFQSARYTRRCMAQAVLTAQNNLSNHTSCTLLNSQFRIYSRLMDNKQGVNNLSDNIINELSAIGATADGPSSWQSKTDKVQLMLRKTKSIPPSCVNQSENGGCTSGDITAENIMFLIQNKKKNEALLSSKAQNVQETKPWEKNSTQNPQVPINRQLPDFKTNNNLVPPSKPEQRDSFLKTVENRVFGGQKRFVPLCPTDSEVVKRRKSYNDFQGNKNEKTQTGDSGMFRTAGTELKLQNLKKYGRGRPLPSSDPYMNNCPGSSGNYNNYGTNKKSLGGRIRTVNSKFVPPVKQQESQDNNNYYEDSEKEKLDERLQLIDPKMIELIQSEIIDNGVGIGWDDIAGLHFAKTTLQEIVVLPMLRPDIYTGLRGPPRGILLFGPPGTGKTLIGKCVASQSKSTFFSISASSLTSKWIGDGEKMVRALFTVARSYQPAVIFIDEIDSLLGQRNDGEHESSRRLKTEFLVHLDGTGTNEDERILLIGATNRPQDLDEAVRRRFVKRLYIPLPDHQARSEIIRNLLSTVKNNLAPHEVEKIAELTDGYSAADMKNVCKEASLVPLRSLSFLEIEKVSLSKVRPVAFGDFKSAVSCVRSSVASDDLIAYIEWDNKYGAGGGPK